MRAGHSTSNPSVRGSCSTIWAVNNDHAPCFIALPFQLLVDHQTDIGEPSSTLGGHR